MNFGSCRKAAPPAPFTGRLRQTTYNVVTPIERRSPSMQPHYTIDQADRSDPGRSPAREVEDVLDGDPARAEGLDVPRGGLPVREDAGLDPILDDPPVDRPGVAFRVLVGAIGD